MELNFLMTEGFILNLNVKKYFSMIMEVQLVPVT